MNEKDKVYNQPRNILRDKLFFGFKEKELMILLGVSILIILFVTFISLYLITLFIFPVIYCIFFGRFNNETNIAIELKKRVLFSNQKKIIIRERSEVSGKDNRNKRNK